MADQLEYVCPSVTYECPVTEATVTVSFECLYISTERGYSGEYIQIIVDRCESCGQDHLIRGE